MGAIHASPEFTFPLQLIYLSSRESSGMFGGQWFCPQLESAVIPQGEGGFVWETPAGNVIPFRRCEPNDSSIYSDTSGAWRAKAASDHQEIYNQDGWDFAYSRGRLKTLTSPTGRVLQFDWSGGDLASMTLVDPASGKQVALLEAKYYGDPDCVSSLVCNGVEHDFSYQDGPSGRLTAWTLPNKEHLYFGYSEHGILSEIQHDNDPIQNYTSWLRDLNLPSSDQKDPANWYLKQDPDFAYTYATKGKKQAVLIPNQITAVSFGGLTQSIDFSPQGGSVVEKEGNDNAHTETYYQAPGKSFNGKLKSIEVNGVVIAEYTYEPTNGYLTSVTDNNGITTYYDYPADWKKDWKHPWDPKPVRVWRGSKDNPQVIAQYSYDDAGRVTSVKDVAGKVTKLGYSPRGELATIEGAGGPAKSITYDAFGRCIQATAGDQTDAAEYDDQGQVTSHTAADGTKTEYAYDALGNIGQVTRNGKLLATYLRDTKGRLTGVSDSLGRVRKIDSDAHGNILSDCAPDGSVTKYQYDKFNRVVAQVDGNGHQVAFTYDAANHLTKQANALGDTIDWTYDGQNHLVEKDNGIQQIHYAYDESGRQVGIDYGTADQKMACTYDDHGRVESMVTPEAGFYYLYDEVGRLDAAREVQGQDDQLLRYQYNDAGQRTGLILAHYVPAIAPAGNKIGYDARYDVLQQTNYDYDADSHLAAISSNGKPVLSYKYDSAGRPVLKTYGNGIQAAITYDSEGRLNKMVFSGGPIENPLTLVYVWDAADQVVARSWNGEVLRYAYDAAGRLLTVTHDIDTKTSEILEDYEYDKAGNITKKVFPTLVTMMTYNAGNELVSSSGGGTTNYTYDRAGRLISYTGGPTNTYGWLDKVIKTTDAQGHTLALTYWPDGQLASEGPDGDSVISKAAYVPSATLAEHFLWDGLALLRRDNTVYIAEPHPSGGAVVASHVIGAPSEDTYYLNDLLGTTLAVVKGNQITFNHLTSFGQARQPSPTAPKPAALQPPVPAAPAVPTPPSVPSVR